MGVGVGVGASADGALRHLRATWKNGKLDHLVVYTERVCQSTVMFMLRYISFFLADVAVFYQEEQLRHRHRHRQSRRNFN